MTETPEIAGAQPHRVRHDGGGSDAVELVRSEEKLVVDSEVRVSGRAVLRRYVVTETVTQTFEVRREEVRLDYEPASTTEPADPAVDAFQGRVVEVVLHREVPVVQLKVEATEIVRLHVDTVTENVEVTDVLRRERVDLDGPGA